MERKLFNIPKYRLQADVYHHHLEEVREQIEKALSDSGLTEMIDVYYDTFHTGDYGVNPLADSDTHSWLWMFSPSGECLYPPKSDIHPRVSMCDLPNLLKFMVDKIRDAA